MTFTSPARSPHTTALLRALDSRTGILVGDGRKPDGGGWQGDPGTSEFVRYLVLHPLPGGEFDGPLGDPNADSSLPWQVTAVGASRAQCEDAADAARAALLGEPITVPDRGGSRVRVDTPGGARPEDPQRPTVWISTERYRFDTTS